MGKDYYVIDCHCHLYRSELQGWQGRAIYDRFDRGGTLEQLVRYMDELGIDQCWVINAWPTVGLIQAGEAKLPKDLKGQALEEARAKVREEVAAKMNRANDWLCSTAQTAPGRVVPLPALDPFMGAEWTVKDLEDKYQKGARGVKMISTWGEFYPNDRRLWPTYARMQELGMVVLSHSGGSNTLFEVKGTDYAQPKYWNEVLETFPRLNVVLAHMGFHWMTGYGTQEQKERIEMVRRFPNIYFDLSQNNEYGFHQFEVDMIREIGVDRCVWASDWHAHKSAISLEGLKMSTLSEIEKRKILGETARRLVSA
ncbi:MAG: amidohydrolase [Chloroflexi bacterium]|nr:amidohydrolase [Chloroflexota bacterium]